MKIKVLFIALLAWASIGTAQITTDWTADMPSSWIPSGVTLADIDTLDSPAVLPFDITLDATTYDNATLATAFNAIGDATLTYVDSTLIPDVWKIDATADIVGAVVIESINREWDNFKVPTRLSQYGVAEDVYRVRGKFKWIILPQ